MKIWLASRISGNFIAQTSTTNYFNQMYEIKNQLMSNNIKNKSTIIFKLITHVHVKKLEWS